MNGRCACASLHDRCKLVVLTGGPGGGKTAVLEIVRKKLCEHIALLPEAASVVFGGGFPRRPTLSGRRAAQRAIFHVQSELERMVIEEGQAAVALCDRGTVDGVAYWPDTPESYWAALQTTREAELSHYAAVIHLRTPPLERGYNHQNPIRIESALEAAAIDERIMAAWAGHPRRFIVESMDDFLEKAAQAVALIRGEVPACCAPCGL